MGARNKEEHIIYDGGERVHAYDRNDRMQTTLISEAICDSFGYLGPLYKSKIYEIVRKSGSLEEVKSGLEMELESSSKFLRGEDITELRQCMHRSLEAATANIEA